MNRPTKWFLRFLLAGAVAASFLTIGLRAFGNEDEDPIAQNARQLIREGRQTFRFDTFGDEAFWGDTLKLHQAIEGSANGGVGPGVSPATALTVGLKLDADALPQSLVEDVGAGKVDLNSPATTLALLKLNAVVGVTGFFNSDGSLQSVGIQCALCHSTVDNSFQAPGIPAGNIGHRLDGWANRDLNVGAIINLSPDLSAPAKLLGVDQSVVRKVLLSWGTGKFDAELFMDGKAFRPDGTTAAVLIPPAYGLAGVNLHTWTGWGSVTYWNAFVANLEMHGKGRFFDSRLNNASQFPIAAANRFANVLVDPAEDRISRSWRGCMPTNWRSPRQGGKGIRSTSLCSAAKRSSTARRSAPLATSRLCIPSRDGTPTRPQMFASIVFKPTARRIGFTGQRHWQDYLRIRRAAFIMMAAS